MTGFDDGHIALILRAVKFSAEKHRHQRRKDRESTPYINHPIEVAEILWRVGGVREIEVVVAALLHDVLEDTKTEPEEIHRLFGSEVLSLVLQVTDDKRLPKLERKRLQIERAPHLSTPAKQIKIADKLCNLRDIVESPPRDWSEEQKRAYVDWTEKVVEGLRNSNRALETGYDEVLQEARKRYPLPG